MGKGKDEFNPTTDLTEGMRVKKKSDGMFATDVYRFMEYTSGLGPDGSRTAQIRNEQTLKKEFVDAKNLKKLMFETISGKSGGKRKTAKRRTKRRGGYDPNRRIDPRMFKGSKSMGTFRRYGGKKSRKSKKSKKSRKNKKSRKSRKSRK